MYKHYPKENGSGFTAEEVRRGLIVLYTDYTCPFCGKEQTVAQMGGYGGDCIGCGESSNPKR